MRSRGRRDLLLAAGIPVLLGAFACACAGAAVVTVPAATATTEEPGVGARRLLPRPPPPPLRGPPGIDLPASLACFLVAPRWSHRWEMGTDAVDLRFSPGGPPYATVHAGTRAALRIAAGAGDASVFDVDALGVLVRGVVDARTFALRPVRPMLVADAIVPDPNALFRLERATPGRLQVAVTLPETLAPLQGRASSDLPCADLGLSPGRYDPLDAVGGRAGKRSARLVGGHLTLHAVRGGPATLDLRPDPGDDLGVTILEEASGQARIAWHTGKVYAVGWVAGAALAPGPPGAGPSVDIDLGNLFNGGPMHCQHDLPLVAHVEGQRRAVGTLARGTHFGVGERVDGYRRVWPSPQVARRTPDAMWLVEEGELAKCRWVRLNEAAP